MCFCIEGVGIRRVRVCTYVWRHRDDLRLSSGAMYIFGFDSGSLTGLDLAD